MKGKLVFQEQDKLLKPCQIEKTVSVFGVVLMLNLNEYNYSQCFIRRSQGESLDSQPMIMGILLEWVVLILKNLYDDTKKTCMNKRAAAVYM